MLKKNYKKGITKYSENLIKNKAIEYLRDLGYNILDFEVPIDFGKLKKYADIVVYSIENEKKSPFIVVETKYKIVDFAWIQIESYAKKLNTPFFAVTDGNNWNWYKTGEKIGESEQIDISHITEISTKGDDSLIKFEGSNDFLRIMFQCYDIIRDKSYKKEELVFELIKMILTKIKDEKDLEKNIKTSREFIITENDTITSVSTRIKNLYEEFNADFLNTHNNIQFDGFYSIKLDNETIYGVVKVLEPYKFLEEKQCNNLKGQFFDDFIKKVMKDNFFTPKEISQFMIDFIDPKFNESILDPACGKGTILIDTIKKVCSELKIHDNEIQYKELLEYINKNIYGIELNPNFFWLTLMNMVFHNFEIGNISLSNALNCITGENTFLNRKFDLIITDPPMGFFKQGLTIDFEDQMFLRHYEDIFLCLSINSLKPSGRLGIVIPNRILNGRSTKKIREFIKDKTLIKAIISLPKNIFNINCSFLFLEKKGINNYYQDDVFVVNAEKIKFKDYSKDILEKYNEFNKKGQMTKKIVSLDDNKMIYGVRGDVILLKDNISPFNFNCEYFNYEDTLDKNKKKVDISQISKRVISGLVYKQLEQNTHTDLIPFIKISDIQNGVISFNDVAFVEEGSLRNRTSRIMSPGDLVISRFVNHKKIAILPSDYDKYVIDKSLYGIELEETILPEYLVLFLKSKFGIMQLEMFKRGVLPSINISDIKRIILPLFHIKVQKRLIDTYNNAQKVEEKNSELICSLKHELDNYIVEKLGFSFDETDISKLNIESSYIKKLEELVVFSDERLNPKEKLEKEYKYIKVNDIKRNQISSYSFIPAKKAQNRQNTLIKKDQIIVPLLEDHLNSISLVPDDFNNSIVSNSFLVLKIDEEHLRYFILYFLNSNIAQSQLKINLKGNAIKLVSKDDFKKICVPLPKEDILKDISKKIKENRDKISNLRDESNAEIQKAEDIIDRALVGSLII